MPVIIMRQSASGANNSNIMPWRGFENSASGYDELAWDYWKHSAQISSVFECTALAKDSSSAHECSASAEGSYVNKARRVTLCLEQLTVLGQCRAFMS